MFIGHFAAAFAAKRIAPAVSLGTLFLATQLADLIWPTLVLSGIEIVAIRPGITAMTPLDFIHYPYSHSLLDVISHRPDMPLTLIGPTRFGFGLWNSIPATIVVEGLMFAAGVALYTRATAASNGIGRNGLRALVAFLAIVYLASAFGPPPPSPAAVAWTAQAIWVLVA